MAKRSGASSSGNESTKSDLSANAAERAHSFEHDLAFYKLVIESVPIAIVSMDPTFRITGFNYWAEKVTGYAAEEALGRQCRDILQSGMCESNCPLKTILDRASSTVSGRTTILDKEKKSIPIRFNAAALFGAGGERMGGVEAFVDISSLVAMERERANFISMLAHDMRSSLTGIHGLGLRLLRRLDDMDKEHTTRHLEVITREAAKLEALIDDFLELSCIEAGRLNLNVRATSLDKEIEELFEIYKVKAAQKGIRLDLQIENILPVIEADTNRLHRVFTNLLDNAIKFSLNRGTVTIAARETEREVMVTVTDEGMGIDPEDLPHIFEVFHRGATTGGTEGHGLGLATVKAIVEAHGGRIVVASEPSQGATFSVFLPKGKPLRAIP